MACLQSCDKILVTRDNRGWPGGYKQSWAIFTQWSGRPLSEGGGGATVTKLLAMGNIGVCCHRVRGWRASSGSRRGRG